MKKIKWVKQLTRENTLLDRSFRVVAYKDSVKEIGKAAIRSPLVGFGRVTSMYNDPIDYKKQQKIIIKEFSGKNIEKMGLTILRFLEKGYIWARTKHKSKPSCRGLLDYTEKFMKHHAHSRGAITYSYWGEPVIVKELKKRLSQKLSNDKLDKTISTLSIPKAIRGPLAELHHSPSNLLAERQALIRKLRPSKEEKELINILSWFTLLYELGERVSSFLFDEFLYHLRVVLANEEIIKEIDWYDPISLINYFKNGASLDKKELAQRKLCYILEIIDNKLVITSGDKAKDRYKNDFEETISLVETDELKGTVASAGYAKGIVKIVITQEDQKKMNQGDVLVSTMTTPRLMLAVNRAVAIVTDEGGLTAHAAIVARELKIPCVVGTKIATKVLKDGDLVEVDANKGIVKKIK